MPRDSHRTVGKLLALSFWEDSAVLDQMAAWIPMVSQSQPHAAPSVPTHVCTQASLLQDPLTLAVHGSCPSCPWGFHLARALRAL